jgi:type IV pilus assembly protein PilW
MTILVNPNRQARNRARTAGFSMVELLVAMTISLIGMIIIFQVFEVSEGIKRTTTSGGDAQQNGAIALYMVDQDLRNAGMGFNDTAYAGCNITASDSTRTPNTFPTAPATMMMVPAQITSGGAANTPDRLTVFYGSQSQVANSTTLTANMVAATDSLRVQSRYGYRVGDVLVLMEPGSGKRCALMEVTGLPAIPSDQVDHNNTSYTLTWKTGAPLQQSRYNPGAGLGVIYGGAGGANATRVFNIGNLFDDNNTTLPVHNTYAIASNSLTVASGFSDNAAAAIADNIVHMRVVYGLDDGVNNGTITYNTAYTAGDGIVDRYVDGTTTPNWQYVIAVRIAVVARSVLAEKPSSGIPTDPCDTTTVAPTWSGSAWATAAPNLMTALDVSADANWKCYRYKVFETTLPMRNWIWKSS